jgi:low temperature requirement protein LtrA
VFDVAERKPFRTVRPAGERTLCHWRRIQPNTGMKRTLIRPICLRSANAEPTRKVTWLELFFDLIFVAAVAQVATPLSTEYSWTGVLRFSFLFLLIWWAWLGHTLFSTRFDTDDAVQRGLTLLQVFAVAAMAVNAKDRLDSRDAAGFAAAYGVMRLVLVAQYVRARALPHCRPLTTLHAAGHGLAAVLWILSSIAPPPARYGLWVAALVFDLGTPALATQLTVRIPPDSAHLPERYGLFTLILLGEAVVAVMIGMEAQATWSVAAGVSAFVSMVIVFAVWWWYYDGVEGTGERPIRTAQDARRFQMWTWAHLPLYLGLAVGGVGLEHVIRVSTVSHLHAGESLLFASALALVMASTTVIAATSPRFAARPGAWRLGAHAALTVTMLMLGVVGATVSPMAMVLASATVLGLQLAISLMSGRDRSAINVAA